MTNDKPLPSLFVALVPLILLIVLLAVNVVLFEDPLGGSNQIALLVAASVASLIAWRRGCRWEETLLKMVSTISSSMSAVLILLLIGALSGAWIVSGVIPMLIYYGVEIMHPAWFLPAALLISSIVSLATGSSWSTCATIGVALIGVGRAMGMNPALVAGAVISGAYFGDKMSPLSDTTNLAPAVSGTDLFTHIRFMTKTTVPTYIITFLIFMVIGLFSIGAEVPADALTVQTTILSSYNVTPWLLLIPAILIFAIIKRVPVIPAMVIGILLGLGGAWLFQTPHIDRLIDSGAFTSRYEVLMQSVFGRVEAASADSPLSDILSSNGMEGMLHTIWLILTAMVFGGAMEAAGALERISRAILSWANNTTSLIVSTIATCILFNITACDQYLAIVVPGNMLKKSFADRGLKPEMLSRALEDSATVTSVLVPWNTCGATQSKVLGIATMDYLPYCFFNLLSPIVLILITAFGQRIKGGKKVE